MIGVDRVCSALGSFFNCFDASHSRPGSFFQINHTEIKIAQAGVYQKEFFVVFILHLLEVGYSLSEVVFIVSAACRPCIRISGE